VTAPFSPDNPFAPKRSRFSADNPFAAGLDDEEEQSRGLMGRITGVAAETLGPLYRTVVEGMAAAGPVGGAQGLRGTARERAAQATQAVTEERERFVKDYPLSSAGLGLAGGLARYGAAATFGGTPGVTALGALEAAASKPEESMAGLGARGAGAIGMEGTEKVLQRIAESPYGRAATDVAFGLGTEQAMRAGKALRSAGAQRRAAKEALEKEAADRLASQEAATRLEEELARTRTARGAEPEPPTPLALPRGPVITPPPRQPLELPAPAFPPESPRFRSRTVAEEAEALAEQQLRDAQRLDEAIAARQQEWERSQAARVAELEAEPSRFPGSPSFRPVAQPLTPVTLREGLENLQKGLVLMGQKAQADEIAARTRFLDEMRAPWDELSPEQQRQFETFMSYYESRKAQGLLPDVEATAVGATGARQAWRKYQNRALRQLNAMESWYKLSPGERNAFFESMERESLARRMGEQETQWQASVREFLATPLDEVIIINPKTGREVTVAAALKRPKNHPARFEAEAFLDELNMAQRELVEGATTGRQRTPYTVSRIGERPTLRTAAEMPPVALPLEERIAERAAGAAGRRAGERDVNRLRNRIGALEPALLAELGRITGGAVVGGTIGATGAEEGQELQGAVGGALLGGLAVGGLRAAARRAPEMLARNEALEDITGVLGRKPKTTTPPGGRFTVTPGGVTETTVGGIKRGTPRPTATSARLGGEPLSPGAEALVGKDRELLRRLGLPPDLQDRIAPRIAEARLKFGTQPRTWQQDMNEAAKLMNTRRELLADISPKGMTGSQGLAIASLVRENTQTIGSLMKEFDAANKALDFTRADALKQQIDELDGQTGRLLNTLVKGRRAQAQALNANKILANLTSDPTYWVLKGMRVKGTEALTNVERQTIANLANSGESEKLLQYLGSLRKSGFLEQFAQLRRAGLLTALAGRARDLISTGANVATETLLRYPGAAVDAILAKRAAKQIGLGAEQFRSIAAPDLQEFSQMARGAKDGFADGLRMLGAEYIKAGRFRDFADFIRTAQVDPSVLKAMDIPQQINIDLFGDTAASKALDTYQKFVMRASGFTDRILRTSAYNGAMLEGARLQAAREGLKGEALAKRVQELLSKPSEDLIADAIAQSELLTFTNDGTLARSIQAMVGILSTEAEKGLPGAGKVVSGATNILLPFRRTPSNIVTRVAEYTPGIGTAMTYKRAKNWLGTLSEAALESQQGKTLSPEMARRVRGEQRKLVQALTRQSAGALGLFGLGFYLTEQGVLTGDLPESAADRELWALEGKQPNSIKLGSQWFPVGQIAPMGNVLTMAANMKQDAALAGPDPSMVDMIQASPFAVARSLLNQPMVTGPKEAMEAATGRRAEGERYLRSQAGSIVPSIFAQAARAEGVQRLPQSQIEAILSRIPGAQEAAPARINIFGEPVRTGAGLGGLLRTEQGRGDPLVQELSRLDKGISPIARWKKEDFAQYQLRQREAGPLVREQLNRLFASSIYQSATDAKKRDLIDERVDRARRRATDRVERLYGIRRPE
jgi:hypothetical protein